MVVVGWWLVVVGSLFVVGWWWLVGGWWLLLVVVVPGRASYPLESTKELRLPRKSRRHSGGVPAACRATPRRT